MALALAAAIRRGERTCVAVAEEAVRRARTSKLNAFARVDAEAANRQLPDGPLRGVPVAVKDMIAVLHLVISLITICTENLTFTAREAHSLQFVHS